MSSRTRPSRAGPKIGVGRERLLVGGERLVRHAAGGSRTPRRCGTPCARARPLPSSRRARARAARTSSSHRPFSPSLRSSAWSAGRCVGSASTARRYDAIASSSRPMRSSKSSPILNSSAAAAGPLPASGELGAVGLEQILPAARPCSRGARGSTSAGAYALSSSTSACKIASATLSSSRGRSRRPRRRGAGSRACFVVVGRALGLELERRDELLESVRRARRRAASRESRPGARVRPCRMRRTR